MTPHPMVDPVGEQGQKEDAVTSSKTAPKPKQDKRNGTPPSLVALHLAVEREYNSAVMRCKATLAVVQSHTLWETVAGEFLCDHDGENWPCSAVIGLGYIYGVDIPEKYDLPMRTSPRSEVTANG